MICYTMLMHLSKDFDVEKKGFLETLPEDLPEGLILRNNTAEDT